MNLKTGLRHFHRKLSPWLLPSLLLVAITGLVYRIGRTWFGMSKDMGGKVLHLHTGAWFGETGSVVYTIFLGSALLFLVISGLWMIFTSKSAKAGARKSHRLLAILFTLPLIITAVTGVGYHIGKKWFQFSEGTLKLLMSLHQGSWLGPNLRPFYILILASGLILLCLTGLRMIRRRKV